MQVGDVLAEIGGWPNEMVTLDTNESNYKLRVCDENFPLAQEHVEVLYVPKVCHT